mgnify:CR=1 FL=1
MNLNPIDDIVNEVIIDYNKLALDAYWDFYRDQSKLLINSGIEIKEIGAKKAYINKLWKKEKKAVFNWWIKRIQYMLSLYDSIRIDHFRGFASYWAIPYSTPIAIHGKWNWSRRQNLRQVHF